MGYFCAGIASGKCNVFGNSQIASPALSVQPNPQPFVPAGVLAYSKQLAAAAAYFCCQGCTNGAISANQGILNTVAAQVGRSFDCTTLTVGAAFTGTAATTICTATSGSIVAVGGSTVLGVCKVPSAGSVAAPSVALLVALFAALAIFF
jgi:hypothetical protein